MMRPIMLLALVALFGCTQGPPPEAQNDPLGHAHGDRLVRRDFPPAWTYDLAIRTEELVKPKLRYPSTARFDVLPHAETYYDPVSDRTQVNVYGNAESRGDAGQDVFQGYYVTWELFGDVKTEQQIRDGQWGLVDAEVLDAQF
jgi:hypothetical protein